MQQHFKNFNGLYFEMGIPARLKRDTQTEEEYWSFLNKFKSHNLYTTVYGLEEPTNYKSAVVDKIFLEFDGEEKIFNEQLRSDFLKFIDYLQKNTDVIPQVFYSGNSGFHVVIHFERINLFNPHHCLQKAIENMQRLSGCKFLDLNANNGLSQMRRIPNSMHQKTKRYAIPLTIPECYFFSCEDIKELSQKPRDIWPEYNLSKTVPQALSFIDQKIEQNKLLRMLQAPPAVKEIPVEECTPFHEVMQGVKYGNRDLALVGLINICRNKGMTEGETLAYVTKWHQENHTWEERDNEWLEYKVKYHFPRNGKHCWWFKKAGFDYCQSCPIRQAMEN